MLFGRESGCDASDAVMRRGGAIDGASRLSKHDCRLREPMIIVYKVFCDYDITCAEMLRNICVNASI